MSFLERFAWVCKCKSLEIDSIHENNLRKTKLSCSVCFPILVNCESTFMNILLLIKILQAQLKCFFSPNPNRVLFFCFQKWLSSLSHYQNYVLIHLVLPIIWVNIKSLKGVWLSYIVRNNYTSFC